MGCRCRAPPATSIRPPREEMTGSESAATLHFVHRWAASRWTVAAPATSPESSSSRGGVSRSATMASKAGHINALEVTLDGMCARVFADRRRIAGPGADCPVSEKSPVAAQRFPSSWRRESNPRPADYKSAALPTELRQHSLPAMPEHQFVG